MNLNNIHGKSWAGIIAAIWVLCAALATYQACRPPIDCAVGEYPHGNHCDVVD